MGIKTGYPWPVYSTPVRSDKLLIKEKIMFGPSSSIVNPSQASILASMPLLPYPGAELFLGRLDSLLRQCCLLGKIFHMSMVFVSVRPIPTGLNPSALASQISGLLPEGCVTGRFGGVEGGALMIL
ncbi:hypothetical protein DSO57_1035611 [Entomophthora muscae]|uniref:Uncharacterized protein n=1 Tax=Entomophthora muscae TaxID=34485 RepID=A0ACC2REA7_9FUNG|nr:hypothetical protein DSO57_1035611 [Entomophthora muscae]